MRGIGKQAALNWRLGYVAEPQPGHEQFAGMLAIPYLTPSGVVDMKFRCIYDHDCKDHGHSKYNKEPGSSTRMFGVFQLRTDSPVVAICEGEFDAVVATECAGIPAVAIPGVKSWKPHYQYMFEGFVEVIVFGDGDPVKRIPNCRRCRGECVGHSTGREFAEKLGSELYNAKVVVLPENEDVNSLVLRDGADALRSRAGLTDG